MYSLGVEFSTQSVKLVLLDIGSAEVVYTGSFDYDRALPRYGTSSGLLELPDPSERHTSPFMLIESLDMAFQKLRDETGALPRLAAVKVDAMQHCTVYADALFGKRIAGMDPGRSLLDQVGPSVTRKTSPIWEDRSTTVQADQLTAALAGAGGIAAITGNRAELRFPAAQVLKWAAGSPDEYRATAHVFLLSAFITSMLAGKPSAVDTGDGWGTNLNSLDIHNPGWSPLVTAAVNGLLKRHGIDDPIERKLGPMAHYDAPAGTIHRYFAARYGVRPEALVLAGTGDNPATLLGCGGSAVVSLGSSFTVNGVMDRVEPSPAGEYNVFGYTKGNAMALSVFTNGAKLHDHFLRKYLRLPGSVAIGESDWGRYAALAGEDSLRGHEPLMLPYLFDESVPLRKMGIARRGFSEDDAAANVRALHLAQAASLRLHSGHLKIAGSLCVVGGASRNALLRRFITDAFDVPTYMIMNADFAAPLGCAVSGAAVTLGLSYGEAARRYVKKDSSSALTPFRENSVKFGRYMERYAAFEREAG